MSRYWLHIPLIRGKIDAYKVYASCIPADIETYLLRKCDSYITCKPNVYFPSCITPIPAPFGSLCAPVLFHKYELIFYFFISVDTTIPLINSQRHWHAMANSTVFICCVLHSPISFGVFKIASVVFICVYLLHLYTAIASTKDNLTQDGLSLYNRYYKCKKDNSSMYNVY